MNKFSSIHVEENVAPLCQLLTYGYPSLEMEKLTKMPQIKMLFVYKNFSTNIFVDEDYWAEAGRNLVERTRHELPFWQDLLAQSEKIKEETLLGLHKLGRKMANNFSDKKELAAVLKKLCYSIFILTVNSQLGAIVDHHHYIFSNLHEEIIKKAQAKAKLDMTVSEVINILTTPTYFYPSNQAEKELQEIKQKLLVGNNQEEILLNNYLERWFWLNYGQLGPGLTYENLKEDLAALKQPALNKDILQKQQQELTKQLGLDEQERSVFAVARIMIYLKGMRAELSNGVWALLNSTAEKIAKELNYQKDNLLFCSVQEFLDYLEKDKNLPSETELKSRRQFSLWIFRDFLEGKILIGEEAKKYLAENTVEKNKISQDIKEFKGNTAFPGKVSGRVKIINKTAEINKMEQGDIMVSIQTTPELLPAMKKAAAFVTDIGGIISHASIVAREMKVPCVVGTRIATQVLHDGDLVEVNATDGVIKKLSK